MRSEGASAVLVDCNDSFTYNVYELLSRAGAPDFRVVPADELVPEELAGSERIILSPGPGVPGEYPKIMRLLDILVNTGADVPVLGICLGHQIIGSYFGAGLYNLETVVHGQPHRLKVRRREPLFEGLPDEFTAGLYHSWALERNLPSGLLLTAESESGVVMGIQHERYPFYGIQFHPESFISEFGLEIIGSFLALGAS